MCIVCTVSMHVFVQNVIVKGTVMQIEKALINDRSCVL